MHHLTPLDIDMHLRELHRQAESIRRRPRSPDARGSGKALAAIVALARRLAAFRGQRHQVRATPLPQALS